MDELILENLRSFSTPTRIPLAPLTVLVGENSTGKSTALAATRIAWDVATGRAPDFNEEPFKLGAFHHMVSAGTKASPTKRIVIGTTYRPRDQRRIRPRSKTEPITVIARFAPADTAPDIASVEIRRDERTVTIDYGEGGNGTRIGMSGPTLEDTYWIPAPELRSSTRFDLQYVYFLIRRHEEQLRDQPERPRAALAGLAEFLMDAFAIGPRPHAISPIRTRPSRTYDALSDTPDAEGSHVPVYLSQALYEPNKNSRLIEELTAYGKSSGMFSDISVRRFRPRPGEPFQLTVSVAGRQRNVVDVGYGVSQVLPVIVEVIRVGLATPLLIQQPEVHLHPRAQAEVGSFLLAMANYSRPIVVETHSDHLIQRLLIECKEGKHDPDLLKIIFLSNTASQGTAAFPLSIDNLGNVRGAPPSYRAFMMEEQSRFL